MSEMSDRLKVIEEKLNELVEKMSREHYALAWTIGGDRALILANVILSITTLIMQIMIMAKLLGWW